MRLKTLSLRGFKSFDPRNAQTLSLGDITVLLGANGSGKSNMLSFLDMLRHVAERRMKRYVGLWGAERLLFHGLQETQNIAFSLTFAGNQYDLKYHANIAFTSSDRHVFTLEEAYCTDNTKNSNTNHKKITYTDNKESNLATNNSDIATEIINFFKKVYIYQFNDTSRLSRIRTRSSSNDCLYLYPDASNLASYLRMLKASPKYRPFYDRICVYIQNILPQFEDFVLETLPGTEGDVQLNWRDSSPNEYLFSPYQLSDGSLRFMALATLLLQPPELLPRLIVLDEPELGMHPAALIDLVSMLKKAAEFTQILLATQSTRLVDEFAPEQIVIVEKTGPGHGTTLKEPDPAALQAWLREDSLSGLWERNVLGGQP